MGVRPGPPKCLAAGRALHTSASPRCLQQGSRAVVLTTLGSGVTTQVLVSLLATRVSDSDGLPHPRGSAQLQKAPESGRVRARRHPRTGVPCHLSRCTPFVSRMHVSDTKAARLKLLATNPLKIENITKQQCCSSQTTRLRTNFQP